MRLTMKINVPAPWSQKECEFLAPYLSPKFIITGICKSTGKQVSYHNATFDWIGINNDKQSWVVGGFCISESLETIDKIEKVTSGNKLLLKLPSGHVEVGDNIELVNQIVKNRGESISISRKKKSGMNVDVFVDILNDRDGEPPRIVDSYTQESIPLISFARFLKVDSTRKADNSLSL